MKTEKSQEIKKLVEKIGVFTEKTGFQPAVGRVLAYLLVSDPPHKTFDEIQRFLNLSKSSASNALNILMTKEFVDYFTKPGDRKRYFRLNISGWQTQLEKQMCTHEALPVLLQEALALRSNKYPEFNRSLVQTIDFISFMDKEMKTAFEKWKTQKKK